MGIEAKAQTQYGDLTGTVSVDGFDGLSIRLLAGKAGYYPVGLEIHCHAAKKGAMHRPIIKMLAVDATILDECSPDGVSRYAEEHGTLPVFRFATDLTIDDVLTNVKRMVIVLQDRTTKGKPLTVAEYDTES